MIYTTFKHDYLSNACIIKILMIFLSRVKNV